MPLAYAAACERPVSGSRSWSWNYRFALPAYGPKNSGDEQLRIQQAFQAHNLDLGLLERYPFTICSVGDLERLKSLVAIRGIKTVMEEKVSPRRRLWLLHGALLDAFPADYSFTRENLFPGALDAITG